LSSILHATTTFGAQQKNTAKVELLSLSLDGVVVWKRVENGFDVIGLFSLVVVQERVVYYQGDFREEHEHRR
jgi:hypothetical protein